MSAPWKYQPRPDLRKRVVLITGASSGVGAATARAFAETGAHVVMAVRDPQKAQGIATTIREAIPDALLEICRLDLAALSSVKALAEGVSARHDRLDLLINNAAVAAIPRQLTADGFEMQMGVAHFGHFALTGRLLPLLLSTAGSRVVTLTSAVAAKPRVDLGDLQSERNYRRYRAYAQAKSANMLFALEFDRRLAKAGAGTLSVTAQPGWTRSGLGPGNAAGRLERGLITLTNAVFGHAPDVGAQPVLMASLAPLAGGTYVTRRHVNDLKGAPKAVPRNHIAADPAEQAGLWAASEELTGVHYAIRQGRPRAADGRAPTQWDSSPAP